MGKKYLIERKCRFTIKAIDSYVYLKYRQITNKQKKNQLQTHIFLVVRISFLDRFSLEMLKYLRNIHLFKITNILLQKIDIRTANNTMTRINSNMHINLHSIEFNTQDIVCVCQKKKRRRARVVVQNGKAEKKRSEMLIILSFSQCVPVCMCGVCPIPFLPAVPDPLVALYDVTYEFSTTYTRFRANDNKHSNACLLNNCLNGFG